VKIEILKQFRRLKPGTVTDAVPDGVANVLIRRGMAREVRRGRPPKSKGGLSNDAG